VALYNGPSIIGFLALETPLVWSGFFIDFSKSICAYLGSLDGKGKTYLLWDRVAMCHGLIRQFFF